MSIFSREPVGKLIGQRIEPTLSLATTTLLLAVAIAVSFGVLAAWKVGTWIDRLVMVLSVVSFSVPVFVVGYLLIYLFSIQLGWLPVQGYTPIAEGVVSWLRHLILPSIALGLAYVALIARITRTAMLDVLSEDYIRTARAKGVAAGPVLMKHALKNAGVPIVTVIGIGVALLIGGVVITETVFNIPRCRPPRGRRHLPARLSHHPGCDADLFGRLCDREPDRRPQLHRARPEDPVLRWWMPPPHRPLLRRAGLRRGRVPGASCAAIRPWWSVSSFSGPCCSPLWPPPGSPAIPTR